MDPRLRNLLEHLQRTRFADLAGARASAHVPVPERLLNDLVKEALPAGGAVREVRIRPHAGNRFDVQIKLSRPAFLPPVNISAVIERQPEFPRSPEIVVRLSSLPGVMSLAGGAAAFFNVLPPGVRMDGDRVHIDLAELARRHGRADALELVRRVQISTDEGTVLVDLDVAV